MQEMMKKRAKELLASGEVTRVIGWKKNEFDYDITPAIFESAEAIDRDFVYDDFCPIGAPRVDISAKRRPFGFIAPRSSLIPR